MDTSLSEEIAEKSLSAKSTEETEIGAPTDQDNPKLPTKAEHRAERIKSSVARLMNWKDLPPNSTRYRSS